MSAVEEFSQAYRFHELESVGKRHAEELDRLRAENAQLRASLDKINDDCLRAEQENERLRQLVAAAPAYERDLVDRAERAEAALDAMKGRDMDATEQPCCGCGKPLLIENAWMEDGCPCNTPAGVNNLNLYRWRLLHELQQQDARRWEKAEAALATALEALREIVAGRAPEDYGRFDICAARLSEIARRALLRALAQTPPKGA